MMHPAYWVGLADGLDDGVEVGVRNCGHHRGGTAADAWFDEYATWTSSPAPSTPCPNPDEADPMGVVGVVMEYLTGRGVALVVDGSLERAVEVAGRLLRCFGVQASDSYLPPAVGQR